MDIWRRRTRGGVTNFGEEGGGGVKSDDNFFPVWPPLEQLAQSVANLFPTTWSTSRIAIMQLAEDSFMVASKAFAPYAGHSEAAQSVDTFPSAHNEEFVRKSPIFLLVEVPPSSPPLHQPVGVPGSFSEAPCLRQFYGWGESPIASSIAVMALLSTHFPWISSQLNCERGVTPW